MPSDVIGNPTQVGIGGPLVANTSGVVVFQTNAGVSQPPGNLPRALTVGGALGTLTLPASGLAADVAAVAGGLTSFQARRGVAGSAGTTTVQLEVNGALVGSSLSWVPADVANTLKSVTFAAAAYVAGDRISLRVTSVETGAEDIFATAF